MTEPRRWATATAVVSCLPLWSGAARAAAPSDVPPPVAAPEAWPKGAPTEAAVTLNRGSEDRLVLADLIKGKLSGQGDLGQIRFRSTGEQTLVVLVQWGRRATA